jgi:hypothetical protein
VEAESGSAFGISSPARGPTALSQPHSQPYKVCARCGQPAVLHMVQCGRCGLSFPPAVAPPYQTTAAPPAPNLSAASQREVARAAPAAGRRRPFLPLLAMLALIALVAFAADRFVRGAQEVLDRAGPVFTGAVGANGPNVSDPTSGLFHERPSGAEQPTIVLGNGAEASLTLVLRGEDGREYRVNCEPNGEARLQVPAGHYTLTISSTSPWIQPNYGDATFRRFKEYDAYFVVDDHAPPIHLGD